MSGRTLAGLAAVLSAAASSACCWLPLALVGVGLSAAGVASLFERFRLAFLAVALVLLGAGFYLNYVRRERCAPGATCATPHSRLRRLNRVALWVSTVFVAAFALFPGYVGSLFGAPSTIADTTEARMLTWTIQIEGMSCAGCEAAVERSVAEVPGVLSVDARHAEARAVASIDPESPPSTLALVAAVGKAGYRLVSVEPVSDASPGPPEGHWLAEIEDEEGSTTPLSMDLGMVNGRWVGEFDLPKYRVADYPVEVRVRGDSVALFFTALGMSFEGALSDDGALAGAARSRGRDGERLAFRRTGAAGFSEDFLRLEAAADDPSVVEILSNDGAELRARFNADRNRTRLLLLLSPT